MKSAARHVRRSNSEPDVASLDSAIPPGLDAERAARPEAAGFLRKHGLKIVLTALMLGLLFANVDMAAMGAHFAALSVGTVSLGIAIAMLQIGFLAFRWVLVARMQAIELPFMEALRCMLASQFFSQGLPASLGGDALRLWWLTRLGMPIGPASQSVLLDRLAGLLALLILNLASVALLAMALSRSLDATGIGLVIAAGLLVMIVGASSLGRALFLWAYQRLPRRIRARKAVRATALWALMLHRGISQLVLSRGGGVVLLWGLAIHLFTVLICYLIAADGGMGIGFVKLLAVIPPVLLVSYLPVSIGGWGVREGSMAFALTLVGGSVEGGVFIGLALGAFALTAALLGAVVWLVSPMPINVLGQRRAPPLDRA